MYIGYVAVKRNLSSALIGLAVLLFCFSVECIVAGDVDDEEAFVEEEEDMMTLSATHPVSGRSEKAMRAIARANFAALDSNKDGRLDLSELAQAHASLTTPEQHKRLLHILDSDHDGYVSESEMVAGVKSIVDLSDSGTGYIQLSHAVITSLCVALGAAAWYHLARLRIARRLAAPVDIRGARLRHLGHPGNDQGQGRDDGDDDGQDGGNSSALCTTTACGSGGESNTPPVSSHSRHGTEVPGIQSAADGKSAGNGSKSSASSGGRGSENSSGGDQGGNGASASGNDTVSSGGSGAGGNDDDDDGDKLRKPGLDNALPEDIEERDDDEEDMDCGEGIEDKAEKRKQGDVLSEDGIHPSAAKRMKVEPVDVRAKRLARFQSQQQGDTSIAAQRAAFPAKVTITGSTPTVSSSAAKTSSAATSASSQRFTSPEKKTDKVVPKKAQPVATTVVEVSPEDTAGLLLAHVLALNLTVAGGRVYQCATSQSSCKLAAHELPTVVDKSLDKVSSIFLKQMRRELDAARYCVACYNRAEQMSDSINRSLTKAPASSPSSVVLLQQQLLADVREISCKRFLCVLKEVCVETRKGNIWSQYSHKESMNPICSLLSRFSRFASDDGGMSATCLSSVMEHAASSGFSTDAFMQLIRAAGEDVLRVSRYDEMSLRWNSHKDALEVLCAQPYIQSALANTLSSELLQCEKGSYFQQKCVLSSLLDISTIQYPPQKINDMKDSCFKEVPGFPDLNSDFSHIQGQIQSAVQSSQGFVHSVLLKIVKKADTRSNCLAWLAGALSTNYFRTAAQFKGQAIDKSHASDGFMLNLCSVMLRLCEPIFTTQPSDRLAKIDPSYMCSQFSRLDVQNEPCLARGRLNNLDRVKSGMQRFIANGSSANFLTECFFLTQYAIYVGLMPAMRRFNSTLSDLQGAMAGKPEEERTKIQTHFSLFYLSWSTCIMDPVMIRLCCDFYITQAVWINMLLQKAEQGANESGIVDMSVIHGRQQKIVSSIPEYAIRDMASWFTAMLRMQPSFFVGRQLTQVVDCCVGLLERTDLLPSPLAQMKIVELLLVFLESNQRHHHGRSELAMPALASIVLGCPAVQTKLGPALLHTYAAVDVIEGLDVDKEEFDKFAARYRIQHLLRDLWHRRVDCRRSVVAMAGSDSFRRFLNATLDTLLYQMNDSLRRVSNVRQMQHAKADEATWSRLSAREKAEKERFLRSEEKVGSGFMKMAKDTLSFLEMVVEEPPVAQMFRKNPLCIRIAAAVIEFTDALCGGQRSELKVKDMDKMNFDPRKLVSSIVYVALCIAGLVDTKEKSVFYGDVAAMSQQSSAEGGDDAASENGFLTALAEHPDYSETTMTRTTQILQTCPGVAEETILGFARLRAEVYNILVQEADSESSVLADLVVEKDEGTEDSVLSSSVAWQDDVEAVDLCMEGLAEIYVEALRDALVDTTEDLAEVHALKDNLADQPFDPRSPKVHALMKEVIQLSNNLPLHPSSSVFLRQDEDRLDVIRAIITGPVDTPYSLGCLAFDIYCPASYPSNPPLVKLITTGSGTVRFNPNLYADGKVCLSLLGTWHGGDASEKWDPATSSIYQVLLSIQGMILIPDPMYNEPGYERMRGTAEGNARSKKYNSSIRLSTVRHAMLGMLRNPPVGFEDIVAVHFTIQKDNVLRQLSTWLRECETPQEERKLRRAVDELRAQLEKM